MLVYMYGYMYTCRNVYMREVMYVDMHNICQCIKEMYKCTNV